jgi:AbrB family looped-hinge helix DNA binding protein
MKNPSTTKMSSKGQVVIPEEIRRSLGLEPGTHFVVVGEGDTIVLKAVSAPKMADFDDIVQEARRQAQLAGLTRSDIAAALRDVRADS